MRLGTLLLIGGVLGLVPGGQARFDNLYPLGCRMISLSVYGSRGHEQYAEVWVERA